MDLYHTRIELNKGKTIYDLPLRVTYYARVSTEKDEQAHSLKNQIVYYSGLIARNPSWVYVDGYIDEGLSGTSVRGRESFLRMLADARAGKFDFIVTKEISRFSRNTLDSIRYTRELLENGVGVLFQSDNINTLLPDSELRLTIMSSIAQDEVRKISERVKFGFRRAIDSGIVLGNAKIWGYDKSDGKLIINEKQAEVVRMIFVLYATQKMGMRAISLELAARGHLNSNGNPLSFTTIKNIILNPKYKGYYCGRKTDKQDYRADKRKVLDKGEWVTYKDEENVPPIVSEELWEKANRILAGRSEKMSSEDKTSYQNKYAYSGKITCAAHSCSYQRGLFRYSSGNKEVWQCKEYIAKGKAGCTSPLLYTAELDQIIRECYAAAVPDKSEITRDLTRIYSSLSQKSTAKQEIAKLKAEMNETAKRKDKLLDLVIAGKLTEDEFESRNNAFNADVVNIEAQIVRLTAGERTSAEIVQNIETLREAIASELNFSGGFDNPVIDCLLDRVEVRERDRGGKIEVKVALKVMGGCFEYRIDRERGRTSVCCASHT
ncbi:MAG: recombinase family protein [Oscillospiraceae bacterium]|nr:recombinase family protein [Oscillospiraceae bacterium]